MKSKDKIKRTAYSSVTSALVTVILILGGFFDMLDLSCASAAALIIHVVYTETGAKNALLVYAVSALLSNLLLPMRSCPVLFLAFFGFFPILRGVLQKKINHEKLTYVLLLLFYNADMILLFTVFKGIFGVQNEPAYMYALLLFSANLFYVCFELLIGRIMIIYNYYIKNKFKKKG